MFKKLLLIALCIIIGLMLTQTACTAVPSADFTSNLTSGDLPFAVQFNDTTTGTPTGWQWDFGDGSANSTEQNPIHAYSSETIPQYYMVDWGDPVASFDNAAAWSLHAGAANIEISDDEVNYKSMFGNSATKFSITGDGGGYIKSTINLQLSGTGQMGLWVYSDKEISAATAIYAGVAQTDGLFGTFKMPLGFADGSASSNQIKPGWNWYQWNMSDMTRDEWGDWDETMVRAWFLILPAAGETFNLTFSAFQYDIEPQTSRVIVRFDDSTSDVFTYGLFDYMADNDIPGTSYIISGGIGSVGSLSLAQCQQLYAAGWDLGVHADSTANHSSYVAMADHGLTSMSNCQQWLITNDFPRASDYYVPPGGIYDLDVTGAAKSLGIKAGGGVMDTISSWGTMDTELQPFDLQTTVLLGDGYTLGQANASIFRAVQHNEVVVILVHKLTDGAAASVTWNVEDTKALLEYCESLDLQFVTISQWYEGMTDPRSFDVVMTATNAEGNDTTIKYITANLVDTPVANFTANVTTGTAPLCVGFTDESTNTPTAWAWDFDSDGVNDSTEQNPSYTYETAGSYDVTLYASNSGGMNVSVKNAMIEVLAPTYIATVMNGTLPATMTTGTTYDVNLTFTNAGTATWTPETVYLLGFGDATSFGDVVFNLTGNVTNGDTVTFLFTITAPAAGEYTVNYTMRQRDVSNFAEEVSGVITVEAAPTPTPAPTATPTPVPTSIPSGAVHAGVLAYSIPAAMTNGTTYTITLNYTNDGQLPWNSSFYLYGMGSAYLFGSTSYTLPGDVAVNGTYNATLTLTPTRNGTYYIAYGIRWKGITTMSDLITKEITVT